MKMSMRQKVYWILCNNDPVGSGRPEITVEQIRKTLVEKFDTNVTPAFVRKMMHQMVLDRIAKPGFAGYCKVPAASHMFPQERSPWDNLPTDPYIRRDDFHFFPEYWDGWVRFHHVNGNTDGMVLSIETVYQWAKEMRDHYKRLQDDGRVKRLSWMGHIKKWLREYRNGTNKSS